MSLIALTGALRLQTDRENKNDILMVEFGETLPAFLTKPDDD